MGCAPQNICTFRFQPAESVCRTQPEHIITRICLDRIYHLIATPRVHCLHGEVIPGCAMSGPIWRFRLSSYE